VHGSGINEVRPPKLANSSEALESRMVDYIPLKFVESDESMNRIADFVGLRGT
jgi:hypothetical protein